MFQSKILVGSLTDECVWVGICTSSPQQSLEYQLWYLIFFVEGVLYEYPLKNILRPAKYLTTWGFSQRYCLGLYLTEVPGWVSAPQAHSRVSNINIDIWIIFCGEESLLIFYEKYIKDGKVLALLGFQSNVFSEPLTAWRAGWVSAPQAHSRVSNINFDIWFAFWMGVSINILCKIY